MQNNLVIVESPAKAKTIEKFLGEGYKVLSSYGHIRDLKTKDFSIDLEHNYAPEYVIPSDKKKLVTELKNEAKKAEQVWLASDEDREGEAISWHLKEMLGIPDELFTPLFATARMVGWAAHRMEEILTGKRIIRPAYKSTRSGSRPYMPISER